MALSLCVFCPFLSAQEFVVGGPDGHFSTIQEAIDFAPRDATIRVEWGIYDGFSLDKPLKILGRPRPNGGSTQERVTILSEISIGRIDCNDLVLLADLIGGASLPVRVFDCRGQVTLSGVSMGPTDVVSVRSLGLLDCIVGSLGDSIPLNVTGSQVSLHDTDIRAPRFSPYTFLAEDSSLWLHRGIFTNEGFAQPIGILTRSRVFWGQGKYGNCVNGPCTGASFLADSESSEREFRLSSPFLEGNVSNHKLDLRILDVPQQESLAVLAMSHPGVPQDSPFGSYWLDVNSVVLVDASIALPLTPLTWDFELAPLPVFLGWQFVFQVGFLDLDGRFVLSTHYPVFL